jgi:hypothetical protein
MKYEIAWLESTSHDAEDSVLYFSFVQYTKLDSILVLSRLQVTTLGWWSVDVPNIYGGASNDQLVLQ